MKTVRCYIDRWGGKTFIGVILGDMAIEVRRGRNARKRLRSFAIEEWGDVRFLKGRNRRRGMQP